MPKVNRFLVTSIIADIKELIAVGNEMCSWIGKVEHLSWRFPTKSARNVNAMAIVQQHKGSAGEMYILLLEMAYDRFHFVLRLVVEFMDSYPFIEEFFNEVTKVEKPRSMSLANLTRILWRRLMLIPETITRNMIKTKHLEGSIFTGYTSRGCQASGSLSSCESCSSACKAIGNLINIISTALQDNNLSSVIVTERDAIRADLFESTQWAAMTKLVDAIDADVKTLLEKISATRIQSETDAKEHKKSLQSLPKELEGQKNEKNLLQIKIKEITDHICAVESELQRLRDNRAELFEDNLVLTESLNESKEKMSNLEILLASTLQQIAEMAEGKMALEDTVKHLLKEITALRQVSIIQTAESEKSLDRFRDEKILMRKQHRDEIEILKEKHAEVFEKLQEECNRSKTIEGKSADILVSKGDPEVDMAQQLASNKEAIDRLTRQNERLSRTLTRLRERRQILEIERNVRDSDV